MAVISEEIEGNGFHQPEIQFILTGTIFVISNLFLNDTVTLAGHKRQQFLKEIPTCQKICSTSSIKDFFIKISPPIEGIIGSALEKNETEKQCFFVT